MKTIAPILFLVFIADVVGAAEVTLKWDPVPDPDLAYYSLYQADRLKDRTGPWQKVRDIAKAQTTTIVTIDAEKNFSWYLTATGSTKGESGPSNTVDRYDLKRMATPACLSLP